jgi:hypothetical protein
MKALTHQPLEHTMQVTTTTNGGARFALIETDNIEMSILLKPGMSPAQSLREHADDLQAQIDRIMRQQVAVRAAADLI